MAYFTNKMVQTQQREVETEIDVLLLELPAIAVDGISIPMPSPNTLNHKHFIGTFSVAQSVSVANAISSRYPAGIPSLLLTEQ